MVRDENHFDEVIDNLEELEQGKEVPLTELFTPRFMQKYTNSETFGEFLEDGGYEVESEQDFRDIPEGEFDRHIATNSSFESWEEMYGKAGTEWTARQLDS